MAIVPKKENDFAFLSGLKFANFPYTKDRQSDCIVLMSTPGLKSLKLKIMFSMSLFKGLWICFLYINSFLKRISGDITRKGF